MKTAKTAIIAEKPSLAREIAAVVGAGNKKEGYMEGNGYLVTWALGHLVSLAMPEEYGAGGFTRENLPVIPDPFILKPRYAKEGKQYKPEGGALKQLKTIKQVFAQAGRIINCCDAGREGELIFRYIYSYLDCNKPFERLWISSLTGQAIRGGLENLRPGKAYDSLYAAAQARSCADWLIGINASKALSIAAGTGVFSLGRVQTPTLAMVCSRYLEHTGFTPEPYWELQLDSSSGRLEFTAIVKERIPSRAAAKELFEKQRQQKTATVRSLEKKEVVQQPPLLYDLTALQKEANSRYGFSAGKTLSLAQKLYEQGYITYPRTGSHHIPDDVFNEIPELVSKLAGYGVLAPYAGKLSGMSLDIRPVDAKKVTDHHGLLITGRLPGDIGYDERKIYDMVAGRMLEAFSPSCVKDSTIVLLDCGGVLYQAKGSVTRTAGWREVLNEKEEDKGGNSPLPELAQGQELLVGRIQLLEKLTRPKPLHTESSLLGAMEIAGKSVGDELQREAIKGCGIGTPATRAAIIETLLARDYMRRDKKSLVPTEKGLAVYGAVKDKRIADVQMTAMWEEAFAKIESGQADAGDFKKGIEVYAAQITSELLNTELSLPRMETVNCPKCGIAPVNFYPKVVKCADEECSLMLFTSLLGKTLSNDDIQTLLGGRRTGLIKGFRGKTGKFFDAALELDGDFKVKFVFADRGKGPAKKR